MNQRIDLNEAAAHVAANLPDEIAKAHLLFRACSEPSYIVSNGGEVEVVLAALMRESLAALPPGSQVVADVSRCSVRDAFAAHCLGVEPGLYFSLSLTDTGGGAEIGNASTPAQERVRALGGTVTVHRIAGIGSVVRALFPAADPGQFDHPLPDFEETRLSGAGTILLVEDEPQVRKYLRDVLAEGGYEVLDAESESDAVLLASRFRGPIDLLLTDMALPHSSGAAIVKSIRALRPGIPVLRMSGYPGNLGAPGESAEHRIHKPFRPAMLLRQIRLLLDSPGME